MRSTPSLRSFPNVAFETVPMFVWLTMALSRPFKKDRLVLPLSTPLSSRRSMVWWPWLCAALSVSSFSTPQIFGEATHMEGLLCPPVLNCCERIRNVSFVLMWPDAVDWTLQSKNELTFVSEVKLRFEEIIWFQTTDLFDLCSFCFDLFIPCCPDGIYLISPCCEQT